MHDPQALESAAGRLIDAVQELSRARCVNRVHEIVRTAARGLAGADGATVVLRDGDHCYYVDEDAVAPLWKGQRFPLETCVSGWTMLHRTPAVIPDIYADDRVPHDAYRPTFVQSMLMVPIRESDPLGAIGTYWAEPHTPDVAEIALLQALANSTAIALENVAVYAELEQRVADRTAELAAANVELEMQSTVDELTGLLNRRGFLTLARQQIAMLERNHRLGALLFIDVDGLKHVNDECGHDAGDALLRLVAHGLRTATRRVDVLSRLSGDEFAILLPEVQEGSMPGFVDRLRRTLADTGLDALGRTPSISIGFTLLRSPRADALEELLAQADAGMYRDKQSRAGVAR